MLSLGSNISSTQAVEAKYSANFDGSGDFIELGDSDDIISTSQANVTLMCWVKPQEEAGNQYIFSNRRSSSSSNFSLRMHSDSGIKFNGLIYTGTGLSTTLTSTTTVTAGTWYHVAITAKANEQKIYINGQLEHTLTLGFGMIPSTDGCTIASFGSTNEYEGLVSELAVFNAYLTGNAVLAAYNSGFDLKTNVGDYTNSSDITHYYKMGNGLFDDKTQGIIHDQDNPGFGAELAPSSLTIVNGSGGGTITQVSGNSYSSTSDGNNTSSIRPKFDFNTESGKTYKLVITPTGSITGTVHFDFNDGSSYLFQDYDFTTTKEIYFTDNGSVFGAFNGQQVYSISGFTMSLKKLNGNPGVTSGGVTFSSDNP
ncbi:LamG domain-containing protein [bacterium]|nr:LamG domain-containing protein [bacterium]